MAIADITRAISPFFSMASARARAFMTVASMPM
jgi:hypothetical protein